MPGGVSVLARVAVVLVVAAAAAPAIASTRATIAAEIEPRLPAVNACYQKAVAQKPWLEGRVLVRFTVEDRGDVGRIDIERTDIDDTSFLTCVEDALRAPFTPPTPEWPAPRELTYPLVFGGGSRDPSVLVDGRARPTTPPARCKSVKECRELGRSFAFGSDADTRRAFEYFSSGCAMGDGASCAGASAALEFGRGVDKDRRKAFTLAEKACALGAARGCTVVGMSHALGLVDAKGVVVVKPNPEKAISFLKRACTGGDGVACLDLAGRSR
ncbi:MAG TPA: AgmX/PglI C-terminal domain-containing protein [Polyangia bacterium]|nr:AgmX/PglI C-terminal domain-containing protein [Polyangia bacterium]